MPRRLPEAQRAAIMADIRSRSHSRNEIARRHDVAASTVAVIAREAGLDFPTPKSGGAGEPARGRAAQIALDTALEALNALRSRIGDLTGRELISLYTAAVDKHLALTGGTSNNPETVRSLLEDLAGQLHNEPLTAPEPETAHRDP